MQPHRPSHPRSFLKFLPALIATLFTFILVGAAQASVETSCGTTVGSHDVVVTYATAAQTSCVVPTGVTSMDVYISGGNGGMAYGTTGSDGASGGLGAEVSGTLTVTPGETLNLYPGQSGQNGKVDGVYSLGGNSSDGFSGGVGGYDGQGAGGSASALTGPSLEIVAGGGGGGGANAQTAAFSASGLSPTTIAGGAGGNAVQVQSQQDGAQGSPGSDDTNFMAGYTVGAGQGGVGGSTSTSTSGTGGAGGTFGGTPNGYPHAGSDGAAGGDASGSVGGENTAGYSGAGGGGGYYGGGSGGDGAYGEDFDNLQLEYGSGGGGGGGSSLAPLGSSVSTTTTPGQIELTYSVPQPGPTCSDQSVDEYLGQSTTTAIDCSGADVTYSATQPTGASVTFDQANGTFSYSANTVHAGSFTITATDANGATAQDVVSVTLVGPPSASVVYPPNNQTYTLNEQVSTDFACQEAANGPGIFLCVDSNGNTSGTGSLDTSQAGSSTYSVTAYSQDGETETASINYTVVGPPTISGVANFNGSVFAQDSVEPIQVTCNEDPNGPGLTGCSDGQAGSSQLSDVATYSFSGEPDTSTLGPGQYTVTATSADGQTTSQTINYTVVSNPTATILSPLDGQTFNQGQVVNTSFSCTEAVGGTGIDYCEDSNGAAANPTTELGTGVLDTSQPGNFTYYVIAESSDGGFGFQSINYTVAGPPSATISYPPDNTVFTQNEIASADFSCQDDPNGPGIVSCTDSNGNSSGTDYLDTSAPGNFTYTVTAVSADGQTGTATLSYSVAGPPTATIQSPATGQTYNLGQNVATSFSCTDDPQGGGIQSCTDSNGNSSGTGQLDTSRAGTFTYTVTATSQDGESSTSNISYSVAGPPSATIVTPSGGQTYTQNQVVPTSFTCSDSAYGPGIQSCQDSNGSTSGVGALDTSKAGTFSYTVTATSQDGQSGEATISYTVNAATTTPPTVTSPTTTTTTPTAPPATTTSPTTTSPTPSPAPIVAAKAKITRVNPARITIKKLLKSGERVRITANGAITGRVRLFVYQRAITRGEKERYPNIAPYSPKVYISATIKVVFAKAGTKTVVLHVLPTVRPRLAHAGQIILGVNVVSIHNHRMQVPIR